MSDPRQSSPQTPTHSTAQEELLKRGLLRISIAGDGITPTLDKQLKALRSALRSDAPAHLLPELLPELERLVLAADDERQERLKLISASLRTLARQLQNHTDAAATNSLLRDLVKRIDQPLHYTSTLPVLLDELATLQGQILDGPMPPASARKGLFSRLFRSPAGHGSPPADATPLPASDAAPVVGVLSGEEQRYSNVAAHIETILLGLLGELRVLDEQRPRCDRLREQITQGLNWYELAAVLDELSGLVLAGQQSRQTEFEAYLKQLNTRLAQFQGNLEQAQTAYSGSAASGAELEGTIREQVANLHEDVRSSEDLNALKANVEAKLDALLSNVDQARLMREQREEEVAAHLGTMVERIQVMELEAQTFRSHLEQQSLRAMLDSLTGLANRAGLQKRMEEEYERWQRYGGQLLLAVLDVDHFKQINDRFGHLAGDKVLRLIAQQLSRRLRKTDFIGRFGGEEFVLLMPGTSLEQGKDVLEQLRLDIRDCPFHFKNDRVTVTISLGYTAFSHGDKLEQVFDRADQAMYKAKQQGRDRVVKAE